MREVIKPSDVYQACNPVTGACLPGAFHYATSGDIHGAMTAAHEAFTRVQMAPSIVRAELLDLIASSLSERKVAIVERAAQETGLCPETRLGGELDRTCSVLRIFSKALRQGDVQDIRITTADPARQPKPRADVRRMRVGIGPVVVIEASNFPFAFGVIGGDAASAMAAGCPVIAKVHPFHPGTSELVGDVVTKAVRESGLPPGFFSLMHGGPTETLELVKHPFTRGVGFTGSRSAGHAIRLAANERLRPLDEISLEMGSLNPVFFLPKALAACGGELARGLHDAILIGGGQFCTKPGHVFVPEGSEGDHFLEVLRAEFRKAVSPILLSTQLSSRYERGCAALEATPGVSVLARGQSAGQGAASVQPTLFLVSADTFLRETLLHEEVFGPMSLIIRAPAGRLPEIAAQYQGELTATVHGAVHEHQSIAELSERLRTRVGRVLFQGFSPGVELCDGVNHGGPWPSALGRSTVVGTTSYERWLRPVCFQDAPYDLLPPELRPDNPLNLSRRVDDEYQVPNSEA